MVRASRQGTKEKIRKKEYKGEKDEEECVVEEKKEEFLMLMTNKH